MTTEYKTEIKKVKKTVEVEEKVRRVIHTLQEPNDPRGITGSNDALDAHDIEEDRASLAWNGVCNFTWKNTAEGYDFWLDVATRLRRLSDFK